MAGAVRLLNWGCGVIQPGPPWVNVDAADLGQEHVEDIGDGLSFPAGTFDGAVASHSLQEIPYNRLGYALDELHRVLVPGGTLRTLSPNPLAAFAAYQRGDAAWFPIGADEPTLDGKFTSYLNWFGTARCLFTPARMIELLTRAGFGDVTEMPWGESRLPDLAALGTREPEQQTIVEGTR